MKIEVYVYYFESSTLYKTKINTAPPPMLLHVPPERRMISISTGFLGPFKMNERNR